VGDEILKVRYGGAYNTDYTDQKELYWNYADMKASEYYDEWDRALNLVFLNGEMYSLSNTRPIAHGGPDKKADVNQAVELWGGNSKEFNGEELEYAWVLIDGRRDESGNICATLEQYSRSDASVYFTARKSGNYKIILNVSNGVLCSRSDEVEVIVKDSSELEVYVEIKTSQIISKTFVEFVSHANYDEAGDLTPEAPFSVASGLHLLRLNLSNDNGEWLADIDGLIKDWEVEVIFKDKEGNILGSVKQTDGYYKYLPYSRGDLVFDVAVDTKNKNIVLAPPEI
jgi:hypothetical protein